MEISRREGFEVAEIFQESHSAKAPHTRPEFERLARDIEKGRFQGILTWSMSRLARNPVDGGTIAYMLQTGKLAFIRTVERTYRPEDNALLLSIENGMATAYLQDLRRNVMRGMKGKAERGWQASKAPIGYKNDIESREIVPDPDRFRLVRKGWDMMLEGNHSVSEIHRELVARGLTIWNRRGSPRPISRTRMHKLFTERFYTGQIKYRGSFLPGKHIPMVTAVEFAKVQDNLRDKHVDRRPHKLRFPFSGTLRCGVCGCAVVAERREKCYPKTRRRATYTYYHCSGSKGCPKLSVSEEELDATFREVIESMPVPRVTAEWLKDALHECAVQASGDGSLDQANLERLIDIEEVRLRRLTDMRLNLEIGGVEFGEFRDEIASKLQTLRAQQFEIEDRDALVLAYANERIDLAVDAKELSGEPNDRFSVGEFIQKAGKHLLTLGNVEIRLDSVINEIATFELLRNGSETPKRGDHLPPNSPWYTLVSDIRSLASEAVSVRPAKTDKEHLVSPKILQQRDQEC
jgi:site-specific DNA recombinase